MKLKEFAANINKLLEERPETGELEVVTSKDDEGNGYNFVNFTPSIGHIDEDREFTEEKEINAVCVN